MRSPRRRQWSRRAHPAIGAHHLHTTFKGAQRPRRRLGRPLPMSKSGGLCGRPKGPCRNPPPFFFFRPAAVAVAPTTKVLLLKRIKSNDPILSGFLSSSSVVCLGVAQPPRTRVPRGRHACSRTVGSHTVGFHSKTPSSAIAAWVAAAVHRRAAVPPTDHQHDASGAAPSLWSRLARGRGRRRPPRIKRASDSL